MPSPVGHLFAGAIAYLAGKERRRRSGLLLGLALLASILPDFDFLPGLLIGDMGAFHHGISHSLAFAFLFGASAFLITRRPNDTPAGQASALATVSYAAHVLLDFVSVNEGARGVPLLWPLSDERFGVNLQLFGHFRYTDIRDGIWSVIRPENVFPILREVVILGGLAAVLFWRERIADALRVAARRRPLAKRPVRPEGHPRASKP